MPEGGNARLAITNSSSTGMLVQMRCGRVNEDLAVPANGTKVRTMSIEDLNGPFALPTTPASCELTSDAPVSTLRVVGTVRGEHNYVAPIRFYDPATATATSLSAVGIETAAETYVVVRNLTDDPIVFTPIVREATLNEPRRAELPMRILLPHSNAIVALGGGLAQLASLGIPTATVTLKTDSPKGAWVGSLTQRSASNGLIEDIPLRTANIPRNTSGAYPLRWDSDYTNLVSITNTSAEMRVARALVTAGGTTYVLGEREIAPGRTAVLDIDSMRLSQTKDVNGLVIPQTAVYGKFMWFDASLGANHGLMGRNSVTSRTNLRKSSFSCGMDCGYTRTYFPVFSVDPFQFTAYGVSFGGTITSVADMSGGQRWVAPYAFSNTQLSSSNSEVLSYSVGPNSNSSYIATAGGVGSVTASYEYTEFDEAYDIFDYCEPNYTQGPITGGGGTVPTVTSSGPANVTLSNESGAANGTDTIQLTAVGSPTGGTYSWKSDNSHVTLTNISSAVVSVQAASAGTSNLTVIYTLNGESGTATEAVSVVQPSSVTITTDTQVQQTNACNNTTTGAFVYNGPTRTVDYMIQQTVGGSPQPLNASVNITETFTRLTTSGNSCGAAPPPTTNRVVPGHFPDIFTNCSVACLPAVNSLPTGSCTSAFEHVWTANGFPIFDHTVTYTCTNIVPQ